MLERFECFDVPFEDHSSNLRLLVIPLYYYSSSISVTLISSPFMLAFPYISNVDYSCNQIKIQCRFKCASNHSPSGAFHNPFFPGLGTDARTGALSQFMTRSVIQFDRHQDAEAKITTSGSFHETFGPKRPASGLFQNPVTRRDLTTPCEDDRTRPMRVNDTPEGLIISKASSGPGNSSRNHYHSTDRSRSLRPTRDLAG